MAFTVRDDLQGRGIGTVLLDVFRKVGFEEHATLEAGVAQVTMELEAAPRYLAELEERDPRSDVASIARLLRPSSIAVVGASHRTGTIGCELLANLVAGGFKGSLYPVNPAGGLSSTDRRWRSC